MATPLGSVCVAVMLVSAFALNLDRRTGEAHAVDVTDPGVVAASDFAMQQLNQQSNSMLQIMQVQIVSATKQLVSGDKYTIEVDAGESSCNKNDPALATKTLAECPVSHPM